MNWNQMPSDEGKTKSLLSFQANAAWLRANILNGSSHMLRGFAQVAFPPECSVCGSPVNQGTRICQTCLEKMVSIKPCCLRCGMPVPEVLPNEDCIRCRQHSLRFGRVIALGFYDGPLQQAVIKCKSRSYEGLRQALAEHLVVKLNSRLPDIQQHRPVLLPVPYHWSRAFTQAAPAAVSLARSLSRLTGWPVANATVRRIRRTNKQGMLSLAERRENVRGAFKATAPKSLSGRHVLIVDDVLTSGATINEVARQLSGCRAKDISALVVARATGW